MNNGNPRENSNRGSLVIDKNDGLPIYSFVPGEPITCSNCKINLSIFVFVCEACGKPFCFDCVKDFDACNCKNYSGETSFIKAQIKR